MLDLSFQGIFALVGVLTIGILLFHSATRPIFTFVYVCFFKPHTPGAKNQQVLLESFYKKQASIYDVTRSKLLKGRNTLLQVIASHITYRNKSVHSNAGDEKHKKKLIWIDIGGGTGSNIETMNRFLDIPKEFDEVYLIDLSTSLADIAKERFERLKWTNVKVLVADASTADLSKLDGKVSLITMSYSLSMIPMYYTLLDRIDNLLCPKIGIVGVVDFYASRHDFISTRNWGSVSRQVGWFSRNFWRIWFEFDNVFLEPSRREYLEYKFGTIKSLNLRNNFLGIPLVHIPYYVWIGCKKDCDIQIIQKVESMATESPYLKPWNSKTIQEYVVDDEIPRSNAYNQAVVNLSANMPLPSFFYQAHPYRRIAYDENAASYMFKSYIYAFTWEDPHEDSKFLELNKDDVVFCITSAGDNALDYAIEAAPRRIHCVDMNPYQNHLLELKLAAYSTLDYETFWKMFGEGYLHNFREILKSKLSPHLTSHALQFWLKNHKSFESVGLYNTGGSSIAIWTAKWLFKITGLSYDVEQICSASSIEHQRYIYNDKIRKVLVNKWVSRLLISNPMFLWKALGVPINQMNMLLEDQSMFDYVADTLDGIGETTFIAEQNYFYLVCLLGHYTRKCHPRYLSPEKYTKLNKRDVLENFRIHTDSIQSVLNSFAPNTVSKCILMDHSDWMTPGGQEIEDEIIALKRALKPDAIVLLRSAARKPWYITNYENHGFICERVAVRKDRKRAICLTNMYASTWTCRMPDYPTNITLANGNFSPPELALGLAALS